MNESPRRYANPFLSDEENDKVNFWNNPELQHSVVKDDFPNNQEDGKFIKSSAACNVPKEFFENATGFYTDNNIIECELPELIVCCKESAFHDVKDICVDDGSNSVPVSGAKYMIEGNLDTLKHERLRSSSVEDLYVNSDLCFGSKDEEVATKECGTEENIVTDSSVSSGLKNVSEDDGHDDGLSKCASKLSVGSNTENHGQGNLTQTGGEKLNSGGNLFDDASTEHLVSDSVLSLQQDRPLTSLEVILESSNNGVNDVYQQPCQSSVEEISKRPLEESEAEDLGRHFQTTNIANESMMEGSIALNIDTEKPATNSGPCGGENFESIHELSVETQNVASDNVATANHIQREGESSFSMSNPVSGHITCSGPIPFSGSISLRSDSSTTSTRSFAFPILQTEWNSSPVRMAKAEQKCSRRLGRWRQGLLCCRF